MPVFITKDHLKTPNKTKTYSDDAAKGQKGFVLRATPNGVFSYYYQYLNKNRLHPKTKKPIREWHLIGVHGEPDLNGENWTPNSARKEATRLAGLAVRGQSLSFIRQEKIEATRAGGVTFGQLHDEYFEWCKELIPRNWGLVPRKESWQNMQYGLGRALKRWRKRVANEITSKDIMALYKEYVAEGSPAQANCMLGDLRTMFNWGMDPDLGYIKINPCPMLHKDKKAVEQRHIGKKRVLTRDEIRTLWFGLDDPKCPGDRYSKLALKLSLVTVLRSGEVTKLPRIGMASDRTTVTVPLKAVKSRRAQGASDVVQPMNSLAREILDEVFSIGNPDREYAFPAFRNQGLIFRPDRPRLKCINTKNRDAHMSQQSLSTLMTRKSKPGQPVRGINQYLGLTTTKGQKPITPLVLRRTAATMLDQLGYSQAVIGKVMTHRTKDKDAAPVTLEYIVDDPIIERAVDPRIEALDKLDEAFRKILGLKKKKLKMAA